MQGKGRGAHFLGPLAVLYWARLGRGRWACGRPRGVPVPVGGGEGRRDQVRVLCAVQGACLVAVSRFLKFPIQMNFSAREKWRKNPLGSGPLRTDPGGYLRGGESGCGRWSSLESH